MFVFQPGDSVFWWKRIGHTDECPYPAEVVAVGAKRVTISVEDNANFPNRFTRRVTTNKLQLVGRYFSKASGQVREYLTSWGSFTRYLEIGEDLWAVRQVDEFENGNRLCYDRTHWIDDFGELADVQMNRNRKSGAWGRSEEIEPAEFERVWEITRASLLFRDQIASARMPQLGSVPIWLTRPRRQPTPNAPKR